MIFFMTHLPKAEVVHIAFHHDVTSVHAFIICLTSLSIQIYIDIYVHISPGGHNFCTVYARKLKFCMLLIQTKPLTLC